MEQKVNRNIWVDYLRSALTVLVVAHHASLAYTTFAKFDKQAYINSTHPIVDSCRWIGLDIFENFNDVFFMALMFLIGGLFLSKSIIKKGTLEFIKERGFRLLIPFLLGGTLLMLLAYFPAYYLAHGRMDLVAYVQDFFTTERWPVGPPWFIWVLFLFNIIFALTDALGRRYYDKLGKQLIWFQNRPLSFFMLLYAITWLLYVPIAYSVGASTWTGIGPFDFQVSRIFLYFGYFILGVLIGQRSFNEELFCATGGLVKKWWVWLLLALLAYGILTVIVDPLLQMIKGGQIKEFYAWMIYYAIYAASCTLSCLAFITTFRRAVTAPIHWWNSLSENAYLIYLVHFVFVTWCQFVLLSFDIPALFKFMITFVFALALSWISSCWLRKIRVIKIYL